MYPLGIHPPKRRTVQGAAIVKPSFKKDKLIDRSLLFNFDEVMKSQVNVPESLAGGKCGCKDRGGVPACQDQYPTPNNSSLVQLATGGYIKSTDRISLFGDSITWLGGYMTVMKEALVANGVSPTFINRGINGGVIKSIRDGCGAGCPGFIDALAADNPTIINIMIGINDVWFAGGASASNSTEFISILTDLVHYAQSKNIKVALSTVSVIGEQVDGKNGHDELLNDFAQATRTVAALTGAGLSDVHGDYLLYEQLNNNLPSGTGLYNGILTVDGVHPCEGSFDSCPNETHGNYILANAIARGLVAALTPKA